MSSPPTTLGQYQIIREIARSNDIVYEAYDPQMDRRVALKELNIPSGLSDVQKQDRIQRFDREAKAAGRLAHPNIMRVFQVANDGERHFMAMEYLDGHTLRNEIDTKGFLPVDRAVEIAVAVLRGLGHAHANGVVHRDIKPDNIQLLSSGEIKITDFGIARLTFQPNLTMDGQVFGTPSYMSPEQVVGKEIDARSDLFSVGVLLYEMVSGQKPFAGDSVVAITYAIMNREPDALTQVNHSMWQVISRALDKSPALRFSSAQEMIEAVEQACTQSVILDTPPVIPGQTIFTPGLVNPGAPPVISPYGMPQGNAPMPVPPPVVYPYNPYQQGMGGALPPHTPSYGSQGFPQTPVYYPPPPRQPLLKPETKNFIGKLLLTLVVMGTLFAVVILALGAIGQALSRQQQQQEDQVTVNQMDEEYGSQDPLQTKIQKLYGMLGHLKSTEFQNEQKVRIATLYESLGKEAMSRAQSGPDDGYLSAAENAFESGNELDPNNPNLMSDLAMLYWTVGTKQQAVADQADAYDKSISWWGQAANVSRPDSPERDRYLEAAGSTCYAKANALFVNRDYDLADDAVKQGLAMVPHDSKVYKQLSDLDSLISQYQR